MLTCRMFFFFFRFLEIHHLQFFSAPRSRQELVAYDLNGTNDSNPFGPETHRLYQFFVMHRWRRGDFPRLRFNICRAPKKKLIRLLLSFMLLKHTLFWGISILSKENSYRVSWWNTDGLWCLMCFSLHISCWTCQWLDVFVGVLFLVSSDKPQVAVFRRRHRIMTTAMGKILSSLDSCRSPG